MSNNQDIEIKAKAKFLYKFLGYMKDPEVWEESIYDSKNDIMKDLINAIKEKNADKYIYIACNYDITDANKSIVTIGDYCELKKSFLMKAIFNQLVNYDNDMCNLLE